MVIRIDARSARNASLALLGFVSMARGRAKGLRIVAREDGSTLVAATESDRAVVPLAARVVVEGEVDVSLKAGLDILCCLDGAESILTRLGDTLDATTRRGLSWCHVASIDASAPTLADEAATVAEGAAPCAD